MVRTIPDLVAFAALSSSRLVTDEDQVGTDFVNRFAPQV